MKSKDAKTKNYWKDDKASSTEAAKRIVIIKLMCKRERKNGKTTPRANERYRKNIMELECVIFLYPYVFFQASQNIMKL